jgi:hypothetical protein
MKRIGWQKFFLIASSFVIATCLVAFSTLSLLNYFAVDKKVADIVLGLVGGLWIVIWASLLSRRRAR